MSSMTRRTPIKCSVAGVSMAGVKLARLHAGGENLWMLRNCRESFP